MTDETLRVAFDHRIFAVQAWGGISRYFAALATHLPECGVDPRIIAPLHNSRHLDALPAGQVWGCKIPDIRGSRRLALAANAVLSAPLARLARARIVHETYYGQKGHTPKGAATVLTVYDMIHELFGQTDGDRAASADKAAAVKRADLILCISHSTRDDLLKFFPEVEPRVRVTHLGFDAQIFTRMQSSSVEERPYLLHVGQRSAYKNFSGLLAAYASSPRLRADFDLVCAGGPPLGPAELAAIADHGLEGRVRQEAVDDAALARRYGGAALFVYPSLYEGFGIPPLEAMASGCPVVAVRVSSVPEVCGDAAHYATDGSPDALREAIEAVVYAPGRRADLCGAGAARLEQFTWQRTAAMTAQYYRELL